MFVLLLDTGVDDGFAKTEEDEAEELLFFILVVFSTFCCWLCCFCCCLHLARLFLNHTWNNQSKVKFSFLLHTSRPQQLICTKCVFILFHTWSCKARSFLSFYFIISVRGKYYWVAPGITVKMRGDTCEARRELSWNNSVAERGFAMSTYVLISSKRTSQPASVCQLWGLKLNASCYLFVSSSWTEWTH